MYILRVGVNLAGCSCWCQCELGSILWVDGHPPTELIELVWAICCSIHSLLELFYVDVLLCV